jgi:pimeloyl-ACP methyl ester carboxylesterase
MGRPRLRVQGAATRAHAVVARASSAAPRRAVLARALASWLCALVAPRAAPLSFAAAPPPVALALVVTGFLLPPAQYASYAELIDGLGMLPVLFSDGSSFRAPSPLGGAATAALSAAEARAADVGLHASAPLVLVGHSRGAKECVLAARASGRRVACMVLLDPVDATSFEPESVLQILEALRVPTCVLGTAAGGGDCAPRGANYDAFYAALARAGTPRLLGVLGRAGHTQFLNDRESLLDVCARGADSDAAVREVALAAVAAWCGRYVPGVVRADRSDRAGSVVDGGVLEELSSRTFRAAVAWQSGGGA